MADAQGVVQSNPMNSTHGKHNHNYSSFPDSLSYKNYMTLRFGDYTPTFFMEGVPKDEISLRASHLVDSLSLNAPFKGSIRKITESFSVPLMAILPRNWDLIYAQPANGGDVPKDANCVITEFPSAAKSFFRENIGNFYGALSEEQTGQDIFLIDYISGLLRFLSVAEMIYSNGSLLNVSGYHAANQFGAVLDDQVVSFDTWYDRLLTTIFAHFNSVTVRYTVEHPTYTRVFSGLSANPTVSTKGVKVESFRSLLELFRENPYAHLTAIDSDEEASDIIDSLKAELLNTFLPSFLSADDDFVWRAQQYYPGEGDDDLVDMSPSNLNLSRLLAYQLVCAHYYSNSAVDFVYSAELYRQYIQHLETIFISYGQDMYFTLNGTRHEYDSLSGYALKRVLLLSGISYSDWISDVIPLHQSNSFLDVAALWSMIFGFRKSLRFGDYFVGSRPRPLAPINTDVAVNNDMVSVIDVTRGIQAQRFANAVMRSRAKIENYVADLFGKMPAPDFHNPFFLTRQAEIIYGDEVQNTGEVQASDANSRTANFKSSDNKFLFTFHNDDAHPCIYLQIVSFDIKRAYSRSIDRHFFHQDRYDMFNPDFQYIGDQPVYGMELGFTLDDDKTIPNVFSYQGRDMEYKQRFDVCSGGFVEQLPGWILTDREISHAASGHLDPDFIRSYNTELDQFFLSLTGLSLANYFHFILIANNQVEAKRPMAVDPQILE